MTTKEIAGQHAGEFVGQFEGLCEGVAIGWVVNTGDPHAKPIVEVLCDDYPVALDRADVFRPDVESSDLDLLFADRCVGFQITIPQSAIAQGKDFRVRIANTQVHLERQTSDRQLQLSTRRIAGEVQANGNLLIAGWVSPEHFRLSPISLTLKEDGVELARVTVNENIPETGNASIPAQARSFRFRLPMSLADGDVHLIDVLDEDGAPLKGSPVPIAAWSTGVDGIIAQGMQSPGMDPRLSEQLGAVSFAFEKAAAYRPASVEFDDYGPWAKSFSGIARPRPVETEMTVFVFGEENASATEISLEEQGQPVTTVLVPDGVIRRRDWPADGIVAFAQAGDTLPPHALARMAEVLETAPIAYSDSEQVVSGVVMPWFKPDWDPDLFISQGYIFGLVALRADAFQFSAVRLGMAKLVVSALNTAAGNVAHCSEVLYRQNGVPGVGAAALPEKWLRPALSEFEPVVTGQGEVDAHQQVPWLNRVHWPLQKTPPKVSIIIPTRDRVGLLVTALSSLASKTQYSNYELIVADNGSADPETLEFLNGFRVSGGGVIDCPGAFNFSAINNRAVGEADGDIICLMNNDIEVIDPGWLSEMVSQLLRPGVGAVGAQLLWSNRLVQHGGVILGIDGGAAHVGNTWTEDDPGYAGTNLVVRQYSAVTAACMVCRKSDYINLGGLDEVAFPVTFNDVDFCLRLRTVGKSVIWSPFAKLLHHESATRGKDELPEKAARARRELTNLRRKWGHVLLDDPHYNINLNRDRAPYEGLALPPARRKGGAA